VARSSISVIRRREEDEVCCAMLVPKGRVGRLQRRASSRLCSPCSRPITSPPVSTAECRRALEKFCDHWHQGTVVTAVTTFGRRGFESMVGTRRGVLRVYGVGSRGHRCTLVTAVTVMTRTTGRA
jgi:hypothetical protein